MSENTVKHITVSVKAEYDSPGETVSVNTMEPLKISKENYDVYVLVRIKDYVYSEADKSEDHDEALAYFQDGKHLNDTISIQFCVTFKKDVSGSSLKWGNDWDTPIRSMLPWGFSAAFASFKYFIDPGIDGDVYADKPWIYGPALSSINYLEEIDGDPSVFEGPVREEDPPSRQTKYLNKNELSTFTFKKGETYAFDFANPYLIMSTSPQIRMPGFTFDVGKYAGLTKLRYVLRNDDELVFAVEFNASVENAIENAPVENAIENAPVENVIENAIENAS